MAKSAQLKRSNTFQIGPFICPPIFVLLKVHFTVFDYVCEGSQSFHQVV